MPRTGNRGTKKSRSRSANGWSSPLVRIVLKDIPQELMTQNDTLSGLPQSKPKINLNGAAVAWFSLR
jgi:hypothetical protein